MKTKLSLLCCLICLSIASHGQGYWTQKANFPLAGRQYQCGFSINHKGYYVFGCGSSFANSTTVAEYNPATNTWVQKADFPGSPRFSSHVFVIDSFAYFISGALWSGAPSDYNCYNDVWKYNPYTDTWTQLGNFPGTGRYQAFAFAYGGKGFFGLGIATDLSYLTDMWEYNPSTDTWTQKTSFPGTVRKSGMMFNIQRYGYVGMGYDNTITPLSDVWRFDAINNTWTQMNNFPGEARCWLSSFSMNANGYVVTGRLLNTGADTKEFWQYNPSDDTWTALPDFGGAARSTSCGFSLDGKIYCGMGYGNSSYLLDFWEFSPTAGIEETTIGTDVQMKLFPNPLNETSVLQLVATKAETAFLTVHDCLGNLILTEELDLSPATPTYYPLGSKLATTANGVYSISVSTANEKLITKTLK